MASKTVQPYSVAGLDPQSEALVPVTIGTLVLNIPRNVLTGIFSSPQYCVSGHGVCGRSLSPMLAFLYPGFNPIPANLAQEFSVLSPAMHKNLIYAVLIGQNEPERVAAFLRGFKADNLLAGPYGLNKFPNVDRILVSFPSQERKMSISCQNSTSPRFDQQCNASEYIFGNLDVSLQFNASLLPEWKNIENEFFHKIDSYRDK